MTLSSSASPVRGILLQSNRVLRRSAGSVQEHHVPGSPVLFMSTQDAAHIVIPVLSIGSNQIICATCVSEVGTFQKALDTV